MRHNRSGTPSRSSNREAASRFKPRGDVTLESVLSASVFRSLPANDCGNQERACTWPSPWRPSLRGRMRGKGSTCMYFICLFSFLKSSFIERDDSYPIQFTHLKNIIPGTSLVGQWLRLRVSNAGDVDAIPGQGLDPKIPHATARIEDPTSS